MANVRISELTAAVAAAGTDQYEINQGGTSKSITTSLLLAYMKANIAPSDIGALATANNLSDVPNKSTARTNLQLPTFYVNQDAETGAADIPSGTTAQRPGSPQNGYFRYNTSNGEFEGYVAGAWGPIGGGGGATGGSTDEVFYENDQNVTTDYTITSGKNAMSAGPITINTGVTVTVPSGSEWTVV